MKRFNLVRFLLSACATLLLLSSVASAQAVSYTYQIVDRTVAANTKSANIVGSGAAFHQLTWNILGSGLTCSIKVDSSANGVTWNNGDIIAAQNCATNNQVLSTSHIVNYVRINITSLAGTAVSIAANLTGYINNPTGGGGGSVLPGTTNHLALYTSSTTVGDSSVIDNGTTVVTAELFGAGDLNNPASTNDTGTGQNYTGSVTAVDGSRTCTNITLNSFCEGIHSFMSWSPASSTVAHTALADLNYATIPSSVSLNMSHGTILASENEADYYGTGGLKNNWAIWSGAAVFGNGTVSVNAGLELRAYTISTSTATVTENIGINAVTENLAAGSTITNDYIYKAAEFTALAGTMTHHYALWIGSQNNAGGANNPDPWGLYEANANERNRLGPITQDQGFTTAGLTHPIQVGVVRAITQTASIATTTISTVGAADTSFIVQGSVVCDSAVSTGTVSLTIGYTDISNTAQTITTSPAACTALGATSFAMVNPTLIQAKATTLITYATTVANSASYAIRAQLYQVGSN